MGHIMKSFDDTELYVQIDKPGGCRAAAVIVHGLCEHQGRYDYVVEKLNGAGIAAYRFDHRGHGRSKGERTHYNSYHEMLDDTNVVVDLAIDENPDLPVFLIGHSMGGFAVSLYGVKYKDKRIKGIITSGALSHDVAGLIRGVPQNLDIHTKLPNELGAGVCSVAEVVDWYGKDPYNSKTFTTGLCYAICEGLDWFAGAAEDFSYPILMLHGEKDGLVSPEDTQLFFKKAASEDRQMKLYGGLFHEIFNEYCRDEVIGDVVSWITYRL